MSRRTALVGFAGGIPLTALHNTSAAAGAEVSSPLRSWADGAARTAILSFVDKVTDESGPDFVPAPQRIAVFDNDGTLWCEQPAYVQAQFVHDRVKDLVRAQPALGNQPLYKAVLDGDAAALNAGGMKAIVTLLMATHAGMTTDEFDRIVAHWMLDARDHRFDKPYIDLVYQPMVELVSYLKSKAFEVFIVSGGGADFMRPWTERVYGIPPERVIGSSIKVAFAMQDDKPVLNRLPEIDFVDDGPGKPVGIHRLIGRRPIFGAGNSDGDLQMLQWTTVANSPSFGLLVHHTDADREYAYDRQSSVGRLDKALDEAQHRGWTVVDMRTDWRSVFAFQAER